MSGPPGVGVGVGSGSAAVTVTVHVALTLPAVTVMTAFPGATPVTVPSAPTEATPSSEEDQVTVSVAMLGTMTALRPPVSLTSSSSVPGSTVTDSAATLTGAIST